jgi:hypothetical protein
MVKIGSCRSTGGTGGVPGLCADVAASGVLDPAGAANGVLLKDLSGLVPNSKAAILFDLLNLYKQIHL